MAGCFTKSKSCMFLSMTFVLPGKRELLIALIVKTELTLIFLFAATALKCVCNDWK